MSSFGRKLAAEFEEEFTRLANGWYLKWHEFSRGEPVEIEDFRGGSLRISSKAFDRATELAYWTAVKRYVSSKLDETFARIEGEIGSRTGERAAQIAEDGAIALRTFVEKLHRHAVFIAYRLQARGYPDERYLASQRDDATIEDIQRRKVELLEKCRPESWFRRLTFRIAGPFVQRFAVFVAFVAFAGGSAAVIRYVVALP
jgi:hypothetical protein